MAMAVSRLHSFQHSSIFKSSLKLHLSAPLIFLPNPNFHSTRTRRFSVSPLLCSTSNQKIQTSPVSTANPSIIPGLLDYLNESWTQFHATEWEHKPGGSCFYTRNMSCLVSFAVGKKYSTGNGFHVIAAHTDSPCLKLKSKSASSKYGYLMVGFQTYGEGLWYTWFDRDLSLAGRVIVRTEDGSFLHKLVQINRPLLRVPTLAIHLDRTVNKDGFKPKLETQLLPLLATKFEDSSANNKEQSSKSSSDEIGCNVDDIMRIELNVCDTQPNCLGGRNNEFIFSGRLDNLASTYCAFRALIDSSGDLSSEYAIRMVALFDNEEGMRRIFDCLAQISWGKCFGVCYTPFLSCFFRYGSWSTPKFLDKHEENHRLELHKGLVIKHNANQRYATTGVMAFRFKEVAKLHNLPTQEFVVRNDMRCGSTIGPLLASGMGIRAVDCGIPQLSMHSVREICGKEDIGIAYKHFRAFYQTFSTIDSKLKVDY